MSSSGVPSGPGADGKTVRNGAGTPAGGLGVNGDFYIDTTATAIYGPKTAGSWGSPTSLIGPTGQLRVRLATTATLNATGVQVVDGITSATGDLVMGKNSGNPALNGIFVADDGGAWPRLGDPTIYRGLSIFVRQGTENGNTNWQLQGLDEPYSPGDIFVPTPMPNSVPVSSEVHWKDAVRVASGDPAVDMTGEQTIQGVNLVTGDRFMRCLDDTYSEAARFSNGIFVVDPGEWPRSTDANSNSNLVNGGQVQVLAGDFQGSAWRFKDLPEGYTLGSTPIPIERLPVAADLAALSASIIVPSRTIASITEDWTNMTVSGSNGWAASGGGTTDVDTSAGNPGQVLITTSAASTYSQIRNAAAWVLEGQDIICEAAVALNALSNSANRYKFAHGLHGTDGVAIQDDGCYWLYNEAVSPNWFAHVVNGAEDYPLDTTVAAVAGAFTYFRMVVNRYSAVGKFYINGVLTVTIPDFFPSTPLFPAAIIERSSSTSALRTGKIDYFNVYQQRAA